VQVLGIRGLPIVDSARAYGDAIQSFSKLTAPDHSHHAFLAASSARIGDRIAAGAHAREVVQREPAFSAKAFLDTPIRESGRDTLCCHRVRYRRLWNRADRGPSSKPSPVSLTEKSRRFPDVSRGRGPDGSKTVRDDRD
jgi:hypothetical protein